LVPAFNQLLAENRWLFFIILLLFIFFFFFFRGLKSDLDDERQRSMSFDDDNLRQKETVTHMLDDMLNSLELEKSELKRILKSKSSKV
jgi:hypothetical protein